MLPSCSVVLGIRCAPNTSEAQHLVTMKTLKEKAGLVVSRQIIGFHPCWKVDCCKERVTTSPLQISYSPSPRLSKNNLTCTHFYVLYCTYLSMMTNQEMMKWFMLRLSLIFRMSIAESKSKWVGSSIHIVAFLLH